MDTTQKPRFSNDRPDSDADLNLLLYKSGKSFKDLFVRLGRGIENIGTALVLALFFLLKNLWWLLLGVGLGIGYGVYLRSTNGAKYSSEMTVKANFGSSRALYSTIDYFNALIRDNKTVELGAIFNRPAQEVKALRNFSLSPVKSELIVAGMYDELFRKNVRMANMPQDTFWVHTMKYEDFKESLSDLDYPVHTVNVSSSSPDVFPSIAGGLTKYISNNRLLQVAKTQQVSINTDEEKLLAASIGNLDSLRRAYNERLTRGQTTVPGANQFTVVEGNPESRAPELDLYDKMLQLQDELKNVKKRSVTQQEILEILSPLNPAGKKETLLESVWPYALAGFLVALVILVLFSIRKSMLAYDAARKQERAI